MKSRKILVFFLSVVMVLSAITPLSAFAETAGGQPVISIKSVNDTAGAVVDVTVEITNNTGILGATLGFTYDSGLTLLNATEGEAFSALTMTKPGKFVSPCRFVWDGQEITQKDVKDGIILTLQFKIDENAEAGTEYSINMSYKKGDILDADLNSVDVKLVNGSVGVVDFLPGDLDGDGIVNTKDIVLLRRDIAGGYDQKVNSAAGDVDNNGERNTRDIILVRRYVAGGYGVELVPSKPQCEHSMTAKSYSAPTCTENGNIAYWHCSKCDKYFSDADGLTSVKIEDTVIDATGHTIVIDSAVEPTYEKTGLTEGKHCSVCNTVIVEQKILPKLKKDEYAITYYIDSNDNYLKSLNIENPNPKVYAKEDGLDLQDLHVNGYNFLGWFTSQSGGTQVTQLAPGTTGNKVLYAHWEKVKYTISFYSPIMEKAPITRTIDQEVFIPDLQLYQYKFMGWTDISGNVVTSVKPGTEDIKLYAHWVSYRNQAITNDYKKDKPLIVEDNDNKQYFFIYYVGKIVNVPLYTIEDFGNTTSGIIRHGEITTTSSISKTVANTITDSVANSTTNSATWTLSKDWNKIVTNNENFTESTLKENSILISDGYSRTDDTTTNSGTVQDTGTITKGNTTTKDLTTNNSGYSEEYGFEVGIGGGKIPAHFDFSGNMEGHYDHTSETGSVKDEGSDEYNVTHTNNLTSKSLSKSNSHNETVSDTISNSTEKNWGYSISDSVGGSNTSSKSTETVQSNSNTYSSAFSYNTQETTTTVKGFSTENAKPGWHRLVKAGTVHVFAVVGFDIATRTYYNYSFSALDDKQYDFYDYSAHNGEYNDYESGVLPFEVPIDVNTYVAERTFCTNGLVVNTQTGMIVNYTGKSEYVNIPDYYSRDNGDGTYSAIKITGIASSAFSGNDKIKEIRLSNYITDIPDSAFENCTSLERVDGLNVTRIGNNAFNNCVSLKEFEISKNISVLGNNAFYHAPKVSAVAANVEIAKSVALCGANNIVLDISEIPETENSNMSFEVGNITTFELQGKDKEYKGLSLKSNAETTIINGVTFTENNKIPMEITSENVALNRVTADCKGYALLLRADETKILVNGTINLKSSTKDAVIAKNMIISPMKKNEVGKLNISGNVLVCGRIVDDDHCLNISDGEVKYISNEEFENYISSYSISFDPNGGSLDVTEKLVIRNMAIGELPVPTFGEYTCLGWYTDDGVKITPETVIDSDLTVHAKWNNWSGGISEPVYDENTKTYIVTNGDELAWISKASADEITSANHIPDNESLAGYTVELANDIYLNDVSGYQNWNENNENGRLNKFCPISSKYLGHEYTFKGSFKGNNHTIYGLYGKGLFGVLGNGSSISDVRLAKGFVFEIFEGSNSYKPYCLGAIAARNSGSITNCINECDVVSVGTPGEMEGIHQGGIVGFNDFANISYCKNFGRVIREKQNREDYFLEIGGIAGHTAGSITYSYNTGLVKGANCQDAYAGGIVGTNFTGHEISFCYNTGDVYGLGYSGGIIGILSNDAHMDNSVVKYCHNSHNQVTGGKRSGGIVGQFRAYSRKVYSQILYCYNSGGNVDGEILGEAYASAADIGNAKPIRISYWYSTRRAGNASAACYSGIDSGLCDVSWTLTLKQFTGGSYLVDPSINGGEPYLKEMKETYTN